MLASLPLSVDWEQVEHLAVCSGETSREKQVNLPGQGPGAAASLHWRRSPILSNPVMK